jgi:hypothetical protein
VHLPEAKAVKLLGIWVWDMRQLRLLQRSVAGGLLENVDINIKVIYLNLLANVQHPHCPAQGLDLAVTAPAHLSHEGVHI